jgi:hypothetical protein
MPVIPAQRRDTIEGFNPSSTAPRGERSTRIHGELKGIPRAADLMTIRSLEQTHTVSLPIDTVQHQVATTSYEIVPDTDDPTAAHQEAAADSMRFFEGRYNTNNQSFDKLTKQVINGILSINTGTIELVPRSDGYLGELYVRDGATMVKAPDRKGRLPQPPEPAFWQFAIQGAIQRFDWDDPVRDLAEHVGTMGYGRFARKPIPFSRDELVWLGEDGKEWHPYGFGRVQKVRRLVEIILNQDVSNRKYFPANEVPEGIVNIVEASQEQVQDVREWWNEEIKGERHKVGILGGNGSDIEWMPFRATPEELEFIESQKWYNKLVWYVFGVSANEIGHIEDVNRAASAEQGMAVWRKTTKPLLEVVQNGINTGILPYMEPYDRVDGELRFEWQFDNPEVEQLEREKQHQDLDRGLRTINEVRQERGVSEVPWGDIPDELRAAIARRHPRWALENWGDVPEDDLPDERPSGDLLSFDGSPDGSPTGTREDGTVDVTRGREDPLAHWTRDALRNERWQGDFPPLKGHADELRDDLAPIFAGVGDDLEDVLEDEWPEERLHAGGEQKQPLPDIDSIVESISVAGLLQDVVVDADVEALGVGAEWHADQLEEELEDRDDDLAAELSFDVEDTMARDALERQAAQRMTTVEESVKARVQRSLLDVVEDGGGVNEATQALRETVDELSDSHSRLVSRTETLDSARRGSQAMAESNDVITGKSWHTTNDGRERDWHAAMDGAVVPKEEPFTVPDVGSDRQPSDYPRSTMVVGGDQPYNCRCDQRPVLDEDMPDDASAINQAYDDVLVYRRTDRMAEIADEHQRRGETLADMLERVIQDAGSVNAAVERLGVSKPTLYDWMDRVDVSRDHSQGRQTPIGD